MLGFKSSPNRVPEFDASRSESMRRVRKGSFRVGRDGEFIRILMAVVLCMTNVHAGQQNNSLAEKET